MIPLCKKAISCALLLTLIHDEDTEVSGGLTMRATERLLNTKYPMLKLLTYTDNTEIPYPPPPPPPLCKKTVNLYAVLLTDIHDEVAEVSGGVFNGQ